MAGGTDEERRGVSQGLYRVPVPALIRSTGVRRAALAVLVAVVALYGGIAATVLFPTTVRTSYYAADVSLSAHPADSSSIHADTVVGTIAAEFTGHAVGVVVEPRVRPEIGDIVAGGSVDQASLMVTEAERSEAIGAAVQGVAVRFALGGLATSLAALGLTWLIRRSRPSAAQVVATAIAWALTTGLVGWTARQTYRPEHFAAVRSTGLLQIAAASSDLLTDLETRSAQATPYLRNLLALSAAVSNEYTPSTLGTPPALTVLFVSDIHGTNQYELMRTIVEERDVDVVVDTGDIINLGTVEEAKVAGITRGIESLGVPYVFVRGNHDATSPSDTRLLRELAEVEGVVLPDPGDGSYHEVSVRGLRIGGFNDPRYYGDSDSGEVGEQHSARDAWLEALGEATAPDIVISHERPALDDVPGRLLVNGHGHTPRLDGNHLEVGSFTGGGALKYFQPTGPDAELVGQPSAFDVLTLDDECRAKTLTRYRYRAVIEGRPDFDEVSVLNASRSMTEPEPGRRCSWERGVSTRPLGSSAEQASSQDGSSQNDSGEESPSAKGE